MNMEYAQDNRTREETKKDFDFGKQQEKEAIFKLPFLIYPVNRDEFGVITDYAPDWFMYKDMFWWPTEFKSTRQEVSVYDLKQNQVDWLVKHGGAFLVSTPTRYAFLPANYVQRCDLVTDTFCSKPCYRVKELDWHLF